MKGSKSNHSTKRLGLMAAITLALIAVISVQPALAANFVFFSVNNDTSLTTMVSGDTVSWGATCDTGATMTWEIWYDINANGAVDDPGDRLITSYSATDGVTSGDNGLPDISPTPDGIYMIPPIILGVAPGHYIFRVTYAGNSKAFKAVTVTPLPTPPNSFHGWLVVAGHPAPDPILQNVWIEAQPQSGDQIWSAMTNDSGMFTINIGSMGTGLEFRIQPSDIAGVVTPPTIYDTVAGHIDSIIFTYGAPSDSIWGEIKDQHDSLIKIPLRVNCNNGTGSQKDVNTSTGTYSIPFATPELGTWFMQLSETELIPNYLVPTMFQFRNDTLHNIRHDFVCAKTDTVLYAKVTENGGHPAHSYVLQAMSNLGDCYTNSVSDTGALNVVTLHIAKVYDSGWSINVVTWDSAHPVPAGYVLDGTPLFNFHPGDTAKLNFISGKMIRDTIKHDGADGPVQWDSVLVSLWRAPNTNFAANCDANGIFTIYGDTGVFSLNVMANGYLVSPPQGLNVHLIHDTTGGFGIQINRAHCRVSGTLTNVSLPLPGGLVVVAHTATGNNGYAAVATVNPANGTYSMYLCDGNWTLDPPSVPGRTMPAAPQVTIGNAPDSVKTADLAYSVVSDVKDRNADGALPKVFALAQNYPNPFNPTTQINYDLPTASHVELTIYDLLGHVVTMLVNTEKPAGRYVAQWDGTDSHGQTLASGVYFYRISAGSYTNTRKMLLLK